MVRDEPILALLAVFFLWGLIRFLPGLLAYGINAVRDFALVYYCLFAFFTTAALARWPDLLGRLVVQLARFVPWLLMWLPFGLLLAPQAAHAPNVPFTVVSVLTHKPDDAAIAALLALGSLWLFPDGRSARSRAAWSIMAFVVIVLSGTQSRGGLLAAVAGAMVGLAFLRDRLRLIVRAVAVIALGLGLATLLSLRLPFVGGQERSFSASQLIENVASIGGAQEPGDLTGTTEARQQLWSLVFHQQMEDGRVSYGFGFGPDLVEQVGDYQLAGGADPLRSPHNSHLDVLARMGLVGFSLWIALWLGWYWRLVAGCQRLAARGLDVRRRVAVLCLMVTTAILVSSFFDPQLEGAQVAVLLWITFGVGVAVTSFRAWFGDQDLRLTTGAGSSSHYGAEP